MIKAIWTPSPNYTEKAIPRLISLIVLHATATDSWQSPLAWLTNKNSGVSAHFLISKEGQLYQLVDIANVAWHAGESSWNGVKMVNKFSVGIELVNKDDGVDPYPFPQLETCADVCVDICKKYSLCTTDVVGHADIAPGRKPDPVGFVWNKFREMLLARGLGA